MRDDGTKEFKLILPEVSSTVLRKFFIGASVQNVQHMIIDGVHLTETVAEWDDEFDNLEEIRADFNQFRSLKIQNAHYEAPDAIFYIL